jgi:hypothetical protein
VLLDLPHDQPEPTTELGVPVSDIIKHNIGLQTGKDMIVMVGRSGCGKIATMVRSAREHFLVYICCGHAMHGGPREFKDVNYAEMANSIMKEYLENYSYSCSTQSQMLARDYKLKSMAKDKITQEVLSRLLLLLHLLRASDDLTPEQFFRAQLSGESDYIGQLVALTKQYTTEQSGYYSVKQLNKCERLSRGRSWSLQLMRLVQQIKP